MWRGTEVHGDFPRLAPHTVLLLLIPASLCFFVAGARESSPTRVAFEGGSYVREVEDPLLRQAITEPDVGSYHPVEAFWLATRCGLGVCRANELPPIDSARFIDRLYRR